MRTVTTILVGVVVASFAAPAAGAPSDQQAERSDNVEVVARFAYKGSGFYVGSDLDFSGRFAYGGEIGNKGGVHIFEVNGTPKEVGFLHCPGTQNDVAVVRPGLLVLGYHDSKCGRVKSGIQLLDVRDPRRVRLLGAVDIPGGTHTLTTYPGTSIIYSSPGGAGGADDETIIDVSDPRRPEVVATFDAGPRVGCHDVAFQFSKGQRLGFCAGQNATQIWDVSKPSKPEVITTIVNPFIWLHHSVAPTPDGKYLVIGDEGFGACNGPANHPSGAIWIYDITNPRSPVLVSFFGLQRSATALVCTAHNFNFVPGTRYLVSSWYAGGMNVLDLSDPSEPKEVAYFRDDTTDYWSAYYYDGRVYASGEAGLDVLNIKGLGR